MATKRRKNKKSFWNQIRFKYKLSFFNENTLEEVWSFRLSQLSAFIILGIFAFLLVLFTAIIIIITPIRNYLPGHLDVEVRKAIVDNALRADSLEQVIAIQALYFDNISAILSGTMEVDSIPGIDSLAYANANYNIPRSQQELDFVRSFEEEEKFNLSTINPNQPSAEAIFLIKPATGIISSPYEPKTGHYGIDLVTAPKETVLSVLDGTVIYTGYDINFGNVIHIQHRNGFLSIYKHNEMLLKRAGDPVRAGEAIAIVGNTGDLATGPHLHFELWYRGTSLNPEDYIVF
ncbi:MAG: M23 family metallopeptidase [Tannerellaceae bacterium]|nr:M23 family metallopeptidase [Tannerellaceae bacterium]